MRTLLLAGLAALAAAPALAAEGPEGVWLVQDQTARVRIEPCPGQADQICGQVVWLKVPLDAAGQPKRDEHNADAGLRSRPLMGMTLIREFKPAGPGRWQGGKIYDPRSGKTYNSKMQLNPDGTLRVDGCIAMFCTGQSWKRVG
jgi:uncharacterized protein (DUF2147 family)